MTGTINTPAGSIFFKGYLQKGAKGDYLQPADPDSFILTFVDSDILTKNEVEAIVNNNLDGNSDYDDITINLNL